MTAKKPDPKAPVAAAVAEVGEVKNKIVYEIGKENNAIDFEIQIIHQGASYEDPNPPAVEEKAATAPVKGGKAPAPGKPADDAKPEIRMITPDPVLMTNESGRTFEFELGRFEKHTASQEALDE